MANICTDEMKKQLLSWKKKDMTVSFITKMFSSTTVKENGKMVIQPPLFNIKMKLVLDANEYSNTEKIVTTVGSYLFNKLLIEGRFEKIIPGGFYDGEVTAGRFGDLMSIISVALQNGKIKIEPTLVGFLADYENYGLKLAALFSPSYSMNLLRPNQEVQKRKEDDMKTAKMDSVQDMSKLETEWTKQAKELLKDDPSMSLYDSGARGSFANNYKNMTLAIGPVENPGTGQYDFVTSNFIDGLQKKDLVAAGNIVVTSEYPKAVNQTVAYIVPAALLIIAGTRIDEISVLSVI